MFGSKSVRPEYLSFERSKFSGVKSSVVATNDSKESLLISEFKVLEPVSTKVVDKLVSKLDASEKSSTKNPLLNLFFPSAS